MKSVLTLCLLLQLSAIAVATPTQDWFKNTPLKDSLQALLSHQTQQAWQELVIAVEQTPVTANYWQPLKLEILRQTDCGHQLTDPSNSAFPPFTLSLISRTGQTSSGYQIKLSIEDSRQSGPFSLNTANGETLISGTLNAIDYYQEWEISELFTKPSPGVYRLNFRNQQMLLLVSDYNTSTWLTRSDNNQKRLTLALPRGNQLCLPASVMLQWFDKQYQQVGDRLPLLATEQYVDLPKSSDRQGAQYLSASALLFEYQAMIKVEYIHRMSLPTPQSTFK
ncbi:DUF2861 family protein [Vibrio salilacus]|uniref:DUF2861 family protein n=1 Tax=Vibrio salilacus TaxID=1323749 RepID=UPI000C2B3500|nr:DUF2861 family protein [Vibrio salilacus]